LPVTWIVNSRQRDARESEAAAIEAAPLGKEGGFELVLKDPYLRWNRRVRTILLKCGQHHR
jgi:hypothetical protein